MQSKSEQPKDQENVLSTLNFAIDGLGITKDIASIANVPGLGAAFGAASSILTMIKDDINNQGDYVELGLACANVCTVLKRGLNGKGPNDLNDLVRKAIERLKTAVEEIQTKIEKNKERGVASRYFHAKNDKDKIAAWRADLNRILHVFNTELAINTNETSVKTLGMVSGMYHTIMNGKGGSGGSMLGEFPPPAPKTFGRDELIEEIVSLAESLTSIALIGVGGIGKTSIALAVLHHDQIKQRFGDDRRFIRCNEFPASRAHFLRRLSQVIGAGIENPEEIAPLRRYLSSKKMVIVLDNAESILGLSGTNGREIYAVVEELGRSSNICICITSRIYTTPPACKRRDIPTLSKDAAREAFYDIYNRNDRSDQVNGILEQLDFHPLSITLLATVGYQNNWDTSRLVEEWKQQRTSMLQAQHSPSLADVIEFSLASPMFRELGPDARELLGVVAFLPQGVDKNNLDWLFPAIPNRKDIFDKFCIISLTRRNNGIFTMLAPLRDYLSPMDPMSSPLLCAAKEHYFARVSVDIDWNIPSFRESQWIKLEDVNVERLLDVFTTIDADSDSIWDTCAKFIQHLHRHKPRLTILKPKIEGLPDDHHSKPECLYELSRLVISTGNYVDSIRLLTRALKLSRERRDDRWVAEILRALSIANMVTGSYGEGIQQAEEALDIYERLGDRTKQAGSLIALAQSLWSDNQLNAAETTVSRAIDLLSETDDQFTLSESHRVLGGLYRSKGETRKAIHHHEVALGIASSFGWHDRLFWINLCLVQLFLDEGRFDDAQAHADRAKPHAVDDAHKLGWAMYLQAKVWYKQRRLEEARAEALRAADILERLGAAMALEECIKFLQHIEGKLNRPVASGQSGSDSRGTKIWRRLFR